MPIANRGAWVNWEAKNTDPYGKCCVDVARRVMTLIDLLPDGTPIEASKLITQADHDLDEGITGYMAGAIATMVSQCHSRGEEFRKSWNYELGKATNQQDSEGVLNPAIITLTGPVQEQDFFHTKEGREIIEEPTSESPSASPQQSPGQQADADK